MPICDSPSKSSPTQLMLQIERWAIELGFNDVAVTDTDLDSQRRGFHEWLSRGHHASMTWLEDNQALRFSPQELMPGTCSILSFRLNYLPQNTDEIQTLKSGTKAYISRYALGRDYHKLMRKRLAQLGKKIEAYCIEHQICSDANTRAFVDSAPVLERPIAEKAGLGWTGKHTLILNKHEGSWFFLGELFTNIPLPLSKRKVENACGSCEACLQICPTDAFPKAYELDANRCISYLTIEHKGSIPLEFREAMGNRIFGCDDCQLICPWNKYAQHTQEGDFQPRHSLQSIDLVELFTWTEVEFLKRTEGSAIRRTGYQSWQRNIAIALGNANKDLRVIEALKKARENASDMLREHIDWALQRQSEGRRRKRKIKDPNKTSKNAQPNAE